VIAHSGRHLVYLGGWRGDRLFVSLDLGPLEPVVDLGWDARAQTTPQRRIAIEGESLFVLEPREGANLDAPCRVRRFDLSRGVEVESREDAVEGEARDFFAMERREGGGGRVLRVGIDRRSGRPEIFEGPVPDLGQFRKHAFLTGTPLPSRGVSWYPIRGVGLLRVGGGGDALFPSDPAPVQEIHGKAVAVALRRGRPGLFVDGVWRPFPRGTRPPWPPFRAPFNPVVPYRTGIAVVSRHGGPLPVLDAPPMSLPPGLYAGIVATPLGPLAVAEGDPPRLVRPSL
jgi:hypothetical protein